MLRTNLSTRPFYNERAVHIAIGAAALLVLALTTVNVFRMLTLSRQNTELSSRISRDQSEADGLTKLAADVLRRVDKAELQLVVDSAREANSLIDQRTFSWTAFFNRIESTMPPDVMLSAVKPSVRDGLTRVTMTVLGRRAEDIDEFMEKLEATGAFEDVVPSQQDRTDEGLFRVTLESVYTGAGAEPEPTEPAPSTGVAPKKAGGAE